MQGLLPVGFVELSTREEADRAMHELNGKTLLGRPLKLGPGVVKHERKIHNTTENGAYSQKPVANKTAFDRWTRIDAADHWRGPSEDNRRLIVSGLPKTPDYHTVNEQVRKLFKGYNMHVLPPFMDIGF